MSLKRVFEKKKHDLVIAFDAKYSHRQMDKVVLNFIHKLHYEYAK